MPTNYIHRGALLQTVEDRLQQYPVVTLLGPRQCGKTTLAREIAEKTGAHFFDLEKPTDRARLAQPMTALEPLSGLVVIDEAQLFPELFPVLRVLADRLDRRARFLLLGSAAPELIRGSSESLAGRTALIDMGGLHLSEVGYDQFRPLWLRGGFPLSYLAPADADSLQWRDYFIQLFLERDLRNFGVQVPPSAMRRLWTMLAHYHGQTWNGSEVSRSLAESHTTVRRHLDILTSAYMVRQLQPWFSNAGKRLVKSPKIYIRDSGLVHALLGIGDLAQLESHPKLGASWEGFVIEQILRMVGDRNAYFWATQRGAELDLLLVAKGKHWGVEIKYSDAPSMTKSMHTAIADLQLEHLWVVYPGKEIYVLQDRVTALSVMHLETLRPMLT